MVECAKNFRYLSLSSLTPRTMAAASLVVASLGARATPRVVASRRVARASSRARRAAAAPVRASGERDDAPSEGSSANDDGNTSSLPLGLSRRNLIDAAFVAVSIPLWRDIAHDLGYLQGPEDAPADLPTPPPGSGYRTATFAGGCFWCMERPFDELDGVIATTSGYTGGFKDQPTYHEVGGGSTGHRESVQILYDPSKVSYETLLNVFWRQVCLFLVIFWLFLVISVWAIRLTSCFVYRSIRRGMTACFSTPGSSTRPRYTSRTKRSAPPRRRVCRG